VLSVQVGLRRMVMKNWLPLVFGPGRVGALYHEAGNDPVEGGPVVEAPTGQEDKVVDRLGCVLRIELEDDVSSPRLHINLIVPGAIERK